MTMKIRNTNLAISVLDDKNPLDASIPVSACSENPSRLDLTYSVKLFTDSVILFPTFCTFCGISIFVEVATGIVGC